MKIADSYLLLVEDEPIIAFALEDMLQDQGARTAFASSVEEAMELVARESFDAAIVDVNLHGSDSYELAREIVRRKTALVFATGYGELAHPGEFASAPTNAKPYDLEAIEAALEPF